MPITHTQPLCESFQALMLCFTTMQKAEGAPYCRFCADPGRAIGRGLRTTAQTRAKSCGERFGGRGEIPHVCAARRRCWTHRTTVDASGQYSGKEASVKARIASEPRLITDVGGGQRCGCVIGHGRILAPM